MFHKNIKCLLLQEDKLQAKNMLVNDQPPTTGHHPAGQMKPNENQIFLDNSFSVVVVGFGLVGVRVIGAPEEYKVQ